MSNYHGWTNYATWRINLEICDDFVESRQEHALDYPDDRFDSVLDLSNCLEDTVEESLTMDGTSDDSLAVSYARSFISDVNFYEIAQNAVSNYPHLLSSEEEDLEDEEQTS